MWKFGWFQSEGASYMTQKNIELLSLLSKLLYNRAHEKFTKRFRADRTRNYYNNAVVCFMCDDQTRHLAWQVLCPLTFWWWNMLQCKYVNIDYGIEKDAYLTSGQGQLEKNNQLIALNNADRMMVNSVKSHYSDRNSNLGPLCCIYLCTKGFGKDMDITLLLLDIG